MSHNDSNKFENNSKKTAVSVVIRKYRKWIALSAGLVILVIVVLGAVLSRPGQTSSQPLQEAVESQPLETSEAESGSSEEMETEGSPEDIEEEGETEVTDTDLSETADTGTDSSSIYIPSGSSSETQYYTPPTIPEEEVIELPYTIPGTNLEIQRIADYSGLYLEDGSDSSASDIAMILLYNAGSEAVEYANITMRYEENDLTFTASVIPAGGRVTVQESDKNSCVDGELLACTADVATASSLNMSQDSVEVTDNGDNTLTVTNLTAQEIVTVRIFYKYYLEDEDAYLGGITYTSKISNLKANESVVVSPSHYASDGSKIVMVRTYDTDA